MGTHCREYILMENLTFTWEPVVQLLADGLHDLGHKHWLEGVKEKALMPYDPDWEAYQRIENNNEFRIIAVRWQGHLIGYAGIRIYNSIQSRGVVCSYIQEYYIEPAFRKKSGSGIKLFRFIHEQLAIMKVDAVTIHQPDIVRSQRGGLGKFFKYLGYETQGAFWMREI